MALAFLGNFKIAEEGPRFPVAWMMFCMCVCDKCNIVSVLIVPFIIISGIHDHSSAIASHFICREICLEPFTLYLDSCFTFTLPLDWTMDVEC